MESESQSRAALLIASSALVAHGVLKRDIPGALAAVIGGGLALCAFRPERTRSSSQAKPTFIRRTVTVMTSPLEAYSQWRKLENLPQFLSRPETVHDAGSKRHSWSVPGKLGLPVTWQTEIVTDQPGRIIEWRSSKDSPIQCAGTIRFTKKKHNRGTKVHLEMSYVPATGFSAKAFNTGLLSA